MQTSLEARHIALHRVITMLNREEVDFLDQLGKDALFSTGHKLSHSEILRGLIDFAMEVGVSGEKIDSIERLKDRITQKISEHKEGGSKNG